KSDDSGSDSSGKSGSPERLSTAEEDKKQDSAAEKKKVDKESEAVNEEHDKDHDKEISGIKEKKEYFRFITGTIRIWDAKALRIAFGCDGGTIMVKLNGSKHEGEL
ncbi:hypothetical protein Tsubulata_033229, partial [Turnera subulata]